jgi:hypothetical protein
VATQSRFVRSLTLLLIPLRPAALLSICVLAAVLAAAAQVGAFGLPLILILLTWLFKYSFAFLDRLVAGDTEAPVLSVDMLLGSIRELRSLVPLILVTVAFFASGAAAFLVGALLAAGAAAALAALLPAVLALQGWTGRLTYSLSPHAWREVTRALGVDYAWLVGCTLALAAICVATPSLIDHVPSIIRIGLWIYGWLALIAIIGGAIHSNRAELERRIPLITAVPLTVSPEESARAREHWLDSIYGAWRSGAESTAWRRVREGMEPGAHTQGTERLAELRWLYGRAASWQPPGFANRIAQELLSHLLDAALEGEALRLLKERLAVDPEFLPETAEQRVRLGKLARQWGEHHVASAMCKI